MTNQEARAIKKLLDLLQEGGPWGKRTEERFAVEEALRKLYLAWRRRKSRRTRQ